MEVVDHLDRGSWLGDILNNGKRCLCSKQRRKREKARKIGKKEGGEMHFYRTPVRNGLGGSQMIFFFEIVVLSVFPIWCRLFPDPDRVNGRGMRCQCRNCLVSKKLALSSRKKTEKGDDTDRSSSRLMSRRESLFIPPLVSCSYTK